MKIFVESPKQRKSTPSIVETIQSSLLSFGSFVGVCSSSGNGKTFKKGNKNAQSLSIDQNISKSETANDEHDDKNSDCSDCQKSKRENYDDHPFNFSQRKRAFLDDCHPIEGRNEPERALINFQNSNKAVEDYNSGFTPIFSSLKKLKEFSFYQSSERQLKNVCDPFKSSRQRNSKLQLKLSKKRKQFINKRYNKLLSFEQKYKTTVEKQGQPNKVKLALKTQQKCVNEKVNPITDSNEQQPNLQSADNDAAYDNKWKHKPRCRQFSMEEYTESATEMRKKMEGTNKGIHFLSKIKMQLTISDEKGNHNEAQWMLDEENTNNKEKTVQMIRNINNFEINCYDEKNSNKGKTVDDKLKSEEKIREKNQQNACQIEIQSSTPNTLNNTNKDDAIKPKISVVQRKAQTNKIDDLMKNNPFLSSIRHPLNLNDIISGKYNNGNSASSRVDGKIDDNGNHGNFTSNAGQTNIGCNSKLATSPFATNTVQWLNNQNNDNSVTLINNKRDGKFSYGNAFASTAPPQTSNLNASNMNEQTNMNNTNSFSSSLSQMGNLNICDSFMNQSKEYRQTIRNMFLGNGDQQSLFSEPEHTVKKNQRCRKNKMPSRIS